MKTRQVVSAGETPFPSPEELAERLKRTRQQLIAWELDALLVTSPENIYYLTGLAHQGHFAFTALVVPTDDRRPVLVARRFEQRTVRAQVSNADFVPYEGNQNPTPTLAAALRDRGVSRGRLGVEMEQLFLPLGVADGVRAELTGLALVDASRLLDSLRLVKSAREIAWMRRAAAISDAGMEAALEATRAGATEAEVTAEIYRALLLAGSEFPGFAPMVRVNERIPLTNTTWTDRFLEADDRLFIELSGSFGRYHAPVGRTIYVGGEPPEVRADQEAVVGAQDAQLRAMKPGALIAAAYHAWHEVISDRLGPPDFHAVPHLGYHIGVAFPPSWVGGRLNPVHPDEDQPLRQGMTFILVSWADPQNWTNMTTDTVLVTANGGERLTTVSRDVSVR